MKIDAFLVTKNATIKTTNDEGIILNRKVTMIIDNEIGKCCYST